MKSKALLICPHIPSADPRIDWVAATANKYYDVTVVGVDYAIKKEIKENNGVYKTITIPISKSADMVRKIAKFLLVPVRQKKHIGNKPSTGNMAVQKSNKQWKQKIKQLLAWWWFFTSIHMTFVDFYKRNKMDYSVIICVDLPTLKVGSKIKTKTGIKMIYDAHEFLAFAYPDSTKLQRMIFFRHEKKYIQFSDAAFSVNKYLARVMEKKLSFSPIYAAPNAAPLEELRNYNDDIERYARGRIKFLFQGRFEAGRGLECLIEAWSKLENDNAALFLRGPDNDYKDYLCQIAQKYGVLGKNVFFLSSVAEENLIAAVRNADVGIIPYVGDILNNKYACPNKLSQYMQAGVAILANDLVYVKNRIDKYNNGVIYNSKHLYTLIDAIQNICNDLEQLNKFKRNSLKYVKLDYNWAIQSKEMDKVFKNLADRG